MSHLLWWCTDIRPNTSRACNQIDTFAWTHPQGWLKAKARKMRTLPDWSQVPRPYCVRWWCPTRSNVTSKIRDWPVPGSVTEVRQFLWLCSYYRKFVKNFSIVAKPLSDLTFKESGLVWNSRCQEAFDELKAKLLGSEITAFPLDDTPFTLDTDACDTGIGAVLSQVQNGRERVIAYASRTLNHAECNYCITNKELLAVRYFVEYFHQYLLGREFCVRSDHQALKWLFWPKEPKSRIARWIGIMSAYQFSIKYRPGRRHGNADGLSRCPNPYNCQCSSTDNLERLRCGPCSKCQKRSQKSCGACMDFWCCSLWSGAGWFHGDSWWLSGQPDGGQATGQELEQTPPARHPPLPQGATQMMGDYGQS